MKNTKHKLTNKDISEQYSDSEFYIMKSELLGSFAYWITYLNPNIEIVSNEPIKAYDIYLKQKYFEKKDTVKKFTYSELNDFINADIFIGIPEIMALNEIKPDFISLGALSKNMFYSICRDHITQPL